MAADASDYPTNADSIPRTNPSDNLTGHSDLHDKMADAIEEIQGFVGVSGDTTAGTIVKRVSDLEAAPPAHNHDATYYTETEVDTLLAGKQNSGSYAAATHTHSYASTTHTHAYASTTHNHDTSYASASHTHSYASTSHAHNYLGNQGRARTITGCSLTGNSYADASLILQSTGAGSADTGAGVSIAFYHTWGSNTYAPQLRAAAEYIYLRDGANADTNKFDVNTIHYRTLTQTSSRTRKENIVDYDGATAVIDQLRPVTYNYIEGDGSTKIGLIAEEVQEVLPIAITEVGETPSLDIGTILGLAIAGLREANTRITALETRVAELEG